MQWPGKLGGNIKRLTALTALALATPAWGQTEFDRGDEAPGDTMRMSQSAWGDLFAKLYADAQSVDVEDRFNYVRTHLPDENAETLIALGNWWATKEFRLLREPESDTVERGPDDDPERLKERLSKIVKAKPIARPK